jgi:hypothetical protein
MAVCFQDMWLLHCAAVLDAGKPESGSWEGGDAQGDAEQGDTGQGDVTAQ